MIIVGALLAAWGAVVLWFARPLHTGWRDMLRAMRARGVENTIPGTEFMASDAGLVWTRRAGTIVLVIGLLLSAAGAVVFAVESM